jgi:hypothetical protein
MQVQQVPSKLDVNAVEVHRYWRVTIMQALSLPLNGGIAHKAGLGLGSPQLLIRFSSSW